MRKLLCKILTRGRHLFRLREHRYRCIVCHALRYQVEPKLRTPEEIMQMVAAPDKIEPIGPGIRDFSVSGVGTDTGTGLPPTAQN